VFRTGDRTVELSIELEHARLLSRGHEKTFMNTNRVVWLDNLRAIGIFLVVWAHHDSEIPPYLLKYIYSFHMPLFFLASGYVFTPQRYQSPKDFVRRKLRSLVLPYVAFSFVTYGFWLAKSLLRDWSSLSVHEVLKTLSSIGIASNGLIFMSHNAALWFLPCLFVVELEFFLLHRMLERKRSGALVSILSLASCSVIGWSLRRAGISLPWGVDVSLTVLFFYAAGYHFKQQIDWADQTLRWMHIVALTAILTATSIAGAFRNGFVNLAFNRMSDPLLFYPTALLATFGYILLSQMIPANSLMNSLGRNTLVIFALHLPLETALNATLRFVLSGHQLGILEAPAVWSLVVSVFQISLLAPIVYAIKRWVPSVLGRTAPR